MLKCNLATYVNIRQKCFQKLPNKPKISSIKKDNIKYYYNKTHNTKLSTNVLTVNPLLNPPPFQRRKVNKPPPSLLSPPSKVLEKNKFPRGLNRGFRVYATVHK